MARMSGSGATCFALCDDDAQAASLAQRISKDRPGWWVKSCRFTRGDCLKTYPRASQRAEIGVQRKKSRLKY